MENKNAFESLSQFEGMLKKQAEGKAAIADEAWHEQFLLLLSRYQIAIEDYQKRLALAKEKLTQYQAQSEAKLEEASLRRLAIAYARYGLTEENE